VPARFNNNFISAKIRLIKIPRRSSTSNHCLAVPSEVAILILLFASLSSWSFIVEKDLFICDISFVAQRIYWHVPKFDEITLILQTRSKESAVLTILFTKNIARLDLFVFLSRSSTGQRKER
jgi:hypothetical protein